MTDRDLEQLHEVTWREIAARKDIISGRRIEAPRIIPSAKLYAESCFREDFPVLHHLAEALSLAASFELAEIAERFSRVMGNLRWSQNPNYDHSNSSRRFLDGYAYAGISGPDAPILCAVPRGGLLLLGPGVVYPGHHHEPKEVYLVMTPGSQWCLDEGDWFDVAPGDLVFHDSWQMHAMRTRDKPLLAFAGWLDAGDRRGISWCGNNVGASRD